MVNYMAKNDIVEINELKNFSSDGYSFSDEFSDENKFVFVKSLISEQFEIKIDFVFKFKVINKTKSIFLFF